MQDLSAVKFVCNRNPGFNDCVTLGEFRMMKSKPVQDPDDFYLQILTRHGCKPYQMNLPGDETLRKSLRVLAENILDDIRSHSPTQDIDPLLRPERVVVTTIPQATVQAITVWIDPVHSIAVNHGLMIFMYRVARALAPHIIIRTANDPPAPPESEAVSIIATMLDWMASPVRAPLIEDWPTGQREIRTADNIAMAGERFVVSHEIAHIMFRHLIVDTSKINTSKISLEDLAYRPFVQEIEADTVGALLSIEPFFAQKLPPQPGVVGIAWFLHCLRLAEEVGAIPKDASHPPADLRLQTLWQMLSERYGTVFGRLTSAANELADLLTRVGDSALTERKTRREKALRYMGRIFREHPAIQGGRNMDLDNEMLDKTSELLRTAPSAVLESIANNLMDSDEYRAVVRADGPKGDRARRHSIAHFLGRQMPEEVRHVLGVSTILSPF
jgi:hypothetical protein